LKQIQQRMENEEQGRGLNQAETGDVSGENSDQYTPPDDFGLLALQNRPPWWNIELGSFVLNFGGRVSVASVKNFQLCDRTDQDYIMLQFGRIQGRHSFTMDFQYPLTAVQAFAIAISSLQSKISFG
jgi:tubby-related protein 1